MTVSASAFAARYKLACFFIANHLYETVVSIDSDIDLSSLGSIQRDDGFYMASLRLVEQLTTFKSDSELDNLQRKIEASGTMYFKKSILTAVVNQGVQPDRTTPDGKPEKKPLENLYDKLIVKKLYDSYFSAYVEDTEPIEFLDKPSKPVDDFVSIFELGVFDSDTLRTISEILDFTDKTGAVAAIQVLSTNPRYAVYKHFFGLASKCL